MIDSARFSEHGAIIAVIDGAEVIVPNDPANRHRRLLAQWEAAGGVIAPYEAPEAPIPDITRRQLRLWMLQHGHDDAAIRAAIATLSEPERSQALIEYEDASTYQRSHPLFDLIGPAFDMTPADVDQAFREAAGL